MGGGGGGGFFFHIKKFLFSLKRGGTIVAVARSEV